MFLKEMQIRNYKNFYNSRFIFKKNINVVIGENDSGKTNAMQAIRLVIDKRLSWYEKEINEKMFSNELGVWQGHVIIISLRFSDIDTTKEDQAMLQYISGNSKKEGSLTWFCIPDTATRKKIEIANAEGSLSEYLKEVTVNNYMTFISCGADIDYLNEAEYQKIIGNLNAGESNLKEKLDEQLFGHSGTELHNNIEYIKTKLVDFTYIDALRDAVYDLKQKTNPLMTMLRQLEPRISEMEKANVKGLIEDVNDSIGAINEISLLSSKINSKIVESVGNTYAPDIMLKSEISDDIKDMFRNLSLKSNKEKRFDLDNIGLGSTNIIYIALKLLEYSFLRELDEAQSKYFLLLFEEPEAHLHKHIQMSLFEKTGLNANNSIQVIMTTHSDNISATSKISNMNIVSKTTKSSQVMQPANGLEPEEINHLERYLDVKRSELLFSKSIILVEGDAEEILIPIMVKKCFGLSLDEMGISLINIGSIGFKNVYQLFNAKRVCKKCAVITDLDAPINKNDTSHKTANDRGIKRKEELENEHKDNIWVQGFYAPYTFEVDLVPSNESYYEKLIDKTYTDINTIKQKKEDLKSGNVGKYGDVALKIASYNKKGWNALMFSQFLDEGFYIPDYILDALIFAGKKELGNINSIKSIFSHYCECHNKTELLAEFELYEKGQFNGDNLLSFISNNDTFEEKSSSIRLLKKILGD